MYNYDNDISAPYNQDYPTPHKCCGEEIEFFETDDISHIYKCNNCKNEYRL